jgi:nucleotidyltransferase substrate binding protein (TIGR01987 family)
MDKPPLSDPRWVLRFENFARAFLLLREGIEILQEPNVPDIVREGVVQRFEYTWELAWKTLKDYLVFKKVTLDKVTAAEVIRTAFEAGYINDGQDWMDALDARNKMSHVYSQEAFKAVIGDIEHRYFKLFDDLHDMLLEERVKLIDA